MIASWMLYAFTTSALAAVAAHMVSRALLGVRRPTRFTWLVAMVVAVCWTPVAMLIARARPDTVVAPVASGLRTATALIIRASEQTLHVPADTLLLTCWIALSALLAFRVARSVRTLNARRTAWQRATVGDAHVLVSDDTGPAVVGLDPMEVVLPSWTLALDEPLRALVLRHEDEHRRARDPHLMLASTLLVILMPWNLALVWMSRRLRLAIELDCDARVLRVHPHHERYGMLLLAIAQRGSGHSTLLATAMSEPAHNLARRIHAMRTTIAPSRARLAGLGLIGAAAIAVACSIDAPSEPSAATRTANTRQSALTGDRAPEPEAQVGTDTGYAVYRTFKTDSGVITILYNKRTNDTVAIRTEGQLGDRVPDSMVIERGERYERVKKELAPMTARAEIAQRNGAEGGAPEQERAVTVRPVVEEGVMVLDGARNVLRKLPEGPDTARAPSDGSQMDHPAQQIEGTGVPLYPRALRDAGVSGEVVASFVVDDAGRVLVGSLKVLKSTDPQFTDAVRAALPAMRFEPARVGGRAVRQLLEMPFTFSIK